MKSNVNDSKAPLFDHLNELRSRLLNCLIFFTLTFVVSYYFSEEIYKFLLQPLEAVFEGGEQRRLIYTALHEAFFTYLKLAFFTALFFTTPIALIQIWKFIAPGMYTDERKTFVPLFFLTPLLFISGAALAFYAVMPLAWEFFISFESLGSESGLDVQLEAKVSEYLSLVIQLLLAFGFSFELPILLFVLAKAGIINAQDLEKHRRHAIVIVFLVAALITPPDIISQIALGVPMLILYEISILLIRHKINPSTSLNMADQKV